VACCTTGFAVNLIWSGGWAYWKPPVCDGALTGPVCEAAWGVYAYCPVEYWTAPGCAYETPGEVAPWAEYWWYCAAACACCTYPGRWSGGRSV
jgi:hypothetical protein